MCIPGAGVGGTCIPINPYYIIQIIERTRDCRPYFSMLKEARKVNDSMAHYVVEQIIEWMKKEGIMRDQSVLLLGYAYKPNIADSRFSPSVKILSNFQEELIKVSVYDPIAKSEVDEKQKKFFIDEVYEGAKGTNCIVAVVGHDIFNSLEFEALGKVMDTQLFFDCTLYFDVDKLVNSGFKYRGIGRS
jgi:nucleotide sugar dehydrogenase